MNTSSSRRLVVVATATALIALLTCIHDGTAQTAQLTARITGKAAPYFEGEPIYLVVTIRNTGTTAIQLPETPVLTNAAQVRVRRTDGSDMMRSAGFVDYVSTEVQSLAQGESVQWVLPVHWFWGSYQEPTDAWRYFAFEPGDYRVSIEFPSVYGISADTLLVQVRVRAGSESIMRERFLQATTQLVTEVRRSGRADVILPRLLLLHRELTSSPYSLLLLADVASALQGRARAYSPRYRSTLDSLRMASIPGAPVTMQIRLAQHLSVEQLDSTVSRHPDLMSIPYIRAAIRHRRGQR